MAAVKSIWVHSSDIDNLKPVMTVNAIFRNGPEMAIKVEIPQSFKDALLAFANAATDLKAAQLRAELLGDEATPAAETAAS